MKGPAFVLGQRRGEQQAPPRKIYIRESIKDISVLLFMRKEQGEETTQTEEENGENKNQLERSCKEIFLESGIAVHAQETTNSTLQYRALSARLPPYEEASGYP